MAFYHVAFTLCATLSGTDSQQCVPEKMVDTKFMGLVSCYSAAKQVEPMAIKSFEQEASKQNATFTDIHVTTRCLTLDEGEAFLKKEGPSALIVTGKEFD